MEITVPSYIGIRHWTWEYRMRKFSVDRILSFSFPTPVRCIKRLSFNWVPFGKFPPRTFHDSACVSTFPTRYLVRTLRHRVYTPLHSFIDIIHACCVLSPHRWRGGWCIFFPLLLFMNESVSHVVMLWVPCWSLTNLPTTRTLSLAREYTKHDVIQRWVLIIWNIFLLFALMFFSRHVMQLLNRLDDLDVGFVFVELDISRYSLWRPIHSSFGTSFSPLQGMGALPTSCNASLVYLKLLWRHQPNQITPPLMILIWLRPCSLRRPRGRGSMTVQTQW